MFVKSKDQVVVISGKDAGKTGKVLSASPKTGKIVVEGVQMVTKHQKARQQGQQGGIVHKEAAIDASNVMVICSKCNKATRVAHEVTYTEENGKKIRNSVRICKKCGKQID